MEPEREEDLAPLPSSSSSSFDDICETLIGRYGKSSAPQHRHLVATAVAMRGILQDESLPLTAAAYFAAAISTLQNTVNGEEPDPATVAVLASFLSIVVPSIPPPSLPSAKASEAASVLVTVLRDPPQSLAAAAFRSLIKTLGWLLKLCDWSEWGAVKLPFEMLVVFTVDKRPKVRKCAQEGIVEVMRSIPQRKALKKASKVVLSLFKRYMPTATEMSALRTSEGSKGEVLSKLDKLEVLHMLNALKLLIPVLSEKVKCKLLLNSNKLLRSHLSPLTQHIFNVLEAIFEFSRAEVVVSELEGIVVSLLSYVSSNKRLPEGTIFSALRLVTFGMGKLYAVEGSIWIKNLPLAFAAIAGFLSSKEEIAAQAADTLKKLTSSLDRNLILSNAANLSQGSPESAAMKSICSVMENILDASDAIPADHTLSVISHLFLKLGGSSYLLMKDILLKLSKHAVVGDTHMPTLKHLQDCIGSAVMAMGPEKILTLLPLSLHAEKPSCSNVWLIPLLKEYVERSSLDFFIENIAPLAKSIHEVCMRVKEVHIRQDLQTCIQNLWQLLPAFCRYPTDTSQNFERLTALLIASLKEDSCAYESIAVALQGLVNQNREILRDKEVGQKSGLLHYSKKVAQKNIKALASSSMDLLQALIDAFFNAPPQKRAHLKDSIRCLSSITDSSKVKSLFISSLKFHVVDEVNEAEESCPNEETVDKEFEGRSKDEQVELKRNLTMELASSLVEGADKDLVIALYAQIRICLQVTDAIGRSEAFFALGKILEEHSWFCSSEFDQLIPLLVGSKTDGDMLTTKTRLTCLKLLFVHVLKNDAADVNEKAFLILNEIILALKDSRREIREAAYDMLLNIAGSLKSSTSENRAVCLQRLFSMILGYLSGSSPHIMSGAVSALSLLIYKDPDLCFSLPELMPSVLALLQSKAMEVIKAVLGFMKVLVLCLEAKDLQKLLSDIVNGVIPWSSVSKHHFRSKVKIIMEIVIRKCGANLVESVAPEKHRGFIRTVVKQRQSSSCGKAAGSSAPETPDANSSCKGSRLQKRKRGECSNSEDNGPWGSSMALHDTRRKTSEDNKKRPKQLEPSQGGQKGSKLSYRKLLKTDQLGKKRTYKSRSGITSTAENKEPAGTKETKIGWRGRKGTRARPQASRSSPNSASRRKPRKGSSQR